MKKAQKKTELITGVMVASVVFGAVIFIILWLSLVYVYYGERANDYQKKLTAVVKMIRDVVDEDDLEMCINKRQASDKYIKTGQSLLQIRNNYKLPYLYVVRPVSDSTTQNCEYLISVMPDVKPKGAGEIGFLSLSNSEFPPELTEYFVSIMNGERDEVYKTVRTDRGILYAEYAALTNSSGQPIGVLGVYYSIDEFREQVLRFGMTVFIIFSVALAIIMFLLRLWIERRVVKPIQLLRENAESFVQKSRDRDNLNALEAEPVELPHNDEIGQLSDALYQMSTDIKSYVRDIVEVERDKNASEASNAAKTAFFFNLSHDIRTPMNAIVGFTNMAQENIANPAKVTECLDNIRMSSDLLLDLINDILEMSRIESGKATVARIEADIEAVFDTVRPAFSKLAEDKDINLSFEVKSIRDRYIFADKVRVKRIIMNLVSNAIKYTDRGGQVKVSASQLPGAGERKGLYQICVEDNGCGMSYEFQKHVFEAFSREDKPENLDIQGTGLGLSLTKSLVDLLGGTIMCQSIPGEGSLFTVNLPFELRTSEGEELDGDLAENMLPENYFRGKRVLLVDDNRVNRTIAIYLLKKRGFSVEEAENGQTALDKVNEKGPQYYDLILMDVLMPIMDGYEATSAIRKQYPDLKAPIIALSANAFDEDKQKSLRAGMDDHIGKPISEEELFASLRRFVK